MRVIAGCVEALARIRPVPTCAVPAVLTALRAASPRAASALLFHLAGPLRPHATALAVAAAAERLHADQEDRVRIHAAQALSRLDGPLPASARTAALTGLRDPLPPVRRYCVHALARVPGPDAAVGAALHAEGGRDDVNLPDVIHALVHHDEQQALLMFRQAISGTTAEDQRRARCVHVAEELGRRARPLLPPRTARSAPCWTPRPQREGQQLLRARGPPTRHPRLGRRSHRQARPSRRLPPAAHDRLMAPGMPSSLR